MVKITITGDTPLEALSQLTAFGMHCMRNEDVCEAANRVLEAERQKEAKEAATQATEPDPTPVTAPTTDKRSPSGPSAAPSEAPVEGPVPTVEEVRAKGVEASRLYGKDAVVALLKQFGASGLSTVAEKDRARFLAELEKLGATANA